MVDARCRLGNAQIMTARIVNLRRARKRKIRDEKRAKADANASEHGLSQKQIDFAARLKAQQQRKLDGHKLSESSDTDD